jgi:hypothetical protein
MTAQYTVITPAYYNYASLLKAAAVVAHDFNGNYIVMNNPVGVYVSRNGMTIRGRRGVKALNVPVQSLAILPRIA